MQKKRLFTPGPTQVPWQVLETQARPLIHHRTEEFRAIHRDALDGLQYLYQTRNPVAILTASGSGAMEAALVNLTRPGEKVLVIVVGKFSERWKELGEAYGLDLVVIEGEWGKPVSPADVEAAFTKNAGIRTVFATHCETSTGVLQDVAAFSKIAHANGALIVVDGITSLGAQDVRTDEWQLDVVIGGSQKGVGTPPGLAFLSVSERARERLTDRVHPVYYFDLAKALKSLEKADTPWTPAVTLIIALNAALGMIRDEGLEQVIERHERNAAAVRAAVQALGLPLFASVPANATTAVRPPAGSADRIRKHMDERYGVKIAGGQGKIKGEIIRLGHLGFYDETDMHTMIAALDATLAELGMSARPGAGTQALIEAFKR